MSPSRRAALFLALAAASATGSCSPPDAGVAGPPRVVASIFPVGDLVAFLAGDAVAVEVLLPPRASPDTWEATPGQIRTLAGAEGYVVVGAGLDQWVAGMVEARAGTRVLRLTDGLELLHPDHDHPGGHEGEEGGDPHIWLDPLLVRDDVVPRLAHWLGGIAPDAAGAIQERADALRDSLTALDREVETTLAPAPRRGFVATHGAWGYFARRYGLEPLGSLYERPGHEPSARGVAGLVQAARAVGLTVVLAEPQMAATAGRALAEEMDGTVLTVDPLGGSGLEGRESYLEMMRFNARAFARALGTP